MTDKPIESPLDCLNAKQQRFVHEYSIDSNGTQAAIRAGYPPKSAQVQASQLLSILMVKTAVDYLKAKQIKNSAVTHELVLSGIIEVIDRCMQSVPVMDSKGRPMLIQTKKHGEVAASYRFQPQHALKGYELLGRHRGMFTDNVTVTDDRPMSEYTDEEIEARLKKAREDRANVH